MDYRTDGFNLNDIDERVMHNAVAIRRGADQTRLGLDDFDGAKIPKRIMAGAQELLHFQKIFSAARVDRRRFVAKTLAFFRFLGSAIKIFECADSFEEIRVAFHFWVAGRSLPVARCS